LLKSTENITPDGWLDRTNGASDSCAAPLHHKPQPHDTSQPIVDSGFLQHVFLPGCISTQEDPQLQE
jgi:hypothetical protein